MTWFLRAHRFSSRLFLLAAILAFVCLAPPARSSDVPAWLSALAHQPVPNYPPETVAVVLFEQQQISVDSSGEVTTACRVAYKILRPEARDSLGSVTVGFDKQHQILSLHAWSIPEEGKVYDSGLKDALETGLSEDELYSDLRDKILQIPAVDPGNIVGYEYEVRGRPYIQENTWWFQESIPVLQADFVLQLPPGWKMKSSWVNYSGPQPRITPPNSYEWILANVPALPRDEDDMPAFDAVAGHLAAMYFSPSSGSVGDDPDSWQALGTWYASLTKDSRQLTPDIQQEVAQLTAGAPTTLDKIRAITNFMQRQIRYVAIEIGIGGFQPHPADTVFRDRYGDCKDMTTLVSAMLQQIGVESYYVLIDTDRGSTQPGVPSLRFDHVILAIRLPKDVPTDNLYAVVNDPKLGKLLFFDSTDSYCPLGYLPAPLQDNFGLVVTPDGGELIKLPLLAPSTNRLLRTAQFTLSASGDLAGKAEEVRWGNPAEIVRWQLLDAAPRDRSKTLEQFLSYFLPSVQLNSFAIGNLDAADQSLVETYSFAASNYAKQSGDMLLFRPCVLGVKEMAIDTEKPRQYPVAFSAAGLDTDQFNITLPPGYVAEGLPDPVHISDAFLDYSSEAKVSGGVLHYARTYEVKSVLVPVADFAALKRDFAAISADESSVVILRPGAQ